MKTIKRIELFRLYKHFKGGYYIPYDITNEEVSGIDKVSYFNVLTGKKHHRPISEWNELVYKPITKDTRYKGVNRKARRFRRVKEIYSLEETH